MRNLLDGLVAGIKLKLEGCLIESNTTTLKAPERLPRAIFYIDFWHDWQCRPSVDRASFYSTRGSIELALDLVMWMKLIILSLMDHLHRLEPSDSQGLREAYVGGANSSLLDLDPDATKLCREQWHNGTQISGLVHFRN